MKSLKEQKAIAAVCGLYCGACSAYIATKEDPARLTQLAGMFGCSEEDVKCHGCRGDIRGSYCSQCRMVQCAEERGIDFCSQCSEYPCDVIKEFQAQAPHRNELWEDLARIREVGYEKWLEEVKEKYTCSDCGTVNSAYDLVCRKCGADPSSEYTKKHKDSIISALTMFGK